MACVAPDRNALIAGTRRWTFGELYVDVRHAAAGLIELGVAQGDRVAIWHPNTWHWVVACLAIHYAGATVVPLNTRYTAGESADVLHRAGARVLIAADHFAGADRVAEVDRATIPALRHIVSISATDDDGGAGWSSLLAASEDALRRADIRAGAVQPDDLSDIVFTSGTTGRSKGVLCSHRQSLSATAAVWSVSGGLTSDDRYLCVNPFFHTFGFRFGIVACLQAGAALVPESSFDPDRILELIAEQRITICPGPPTLYQMLLDHPDRTRFDLSSWRLAVTGSTILPRPLIERMQSELHLQTVVTGYGLTEASGYGTTTRPGDDAVTVATTVGRPIPGFELRIDDPDDMGAGEVLLRGANVMLGYLDDPQATAETIDDEGWLHTGDVGTTDENGNLRIVGRLKDMYVCSGFNVYPAEVEQALLRLGGVREAAVVGVPDPRNGEVGRAFIVVRPDAGLDEKVVKAFARTHLADFKVPRSVVFTDELPRNAMGKVLKGELREIGVSARPATEQGATLEGWVESWVADAWQSLLDIDRPGRLDRFSDLGGDSGAAVEFCRMVESALGVRISVDRFAALQTIASTVSELQSSGRRRRQIVVPLRADGCGPVCVAVPGLHGNSWTYCRTAAALTGPCDVLAVTPADVGSRRRSHIRPSIRSAVAEALRSEAAANRPVVLIGYSFGAVVATDLACWLAEQGISVEKLVFLDPKPLDGARPKRSPSARMSTVIKDAGRPVLHRMKRTGAFRRIARSAGRWQSDIHLSPAARQLQTEIHAVGRRLAGEYLDGSIRLPTIPVACLRSRELVAEQGPMPALFSAPMAGVDTDVLDILHGELLSGRSAVRQVAAWLDRHLTA